MNNANIGFIVKSNEFQQDSVVRFYPEREISRMIAETYSNETITRIVYFECPENNG